MGEYKNHKFDLRQLTVSHVLVGVVLLLTILTIAVVAIDLLLNGPLVWPW